MKLSDRKGIINLFVFHSLSLSPLSLIAWKRIINETFDRARARRISRSSRFFPEEQKSSESVMKAVLKQHIRFVSCRRVEKLHRFSVALGEGRDD